MSENYKNIMDKITVDKEMKKRILNGINDINNKKEIKHKKKYTNKYYKNFGMIAACCAIVILSVNNKQIYDFNKNYVQNTEIASDESQSNNNEVSQSEEKTEKDLKNDEVNLSEITNNSVNNKLVDTEESNNNPINYDSSNDNSVKSSSNNISENDHSEVNNKTINKENRGDIGEENNSNTKQEEITNENSGIAVAQYNDATQVGIPEGQSRSLNREFKSLDELKNSIDFQIKTLKVNPKSNEIKSIIMELIGRILIKYENENYSLIFKIEKTTNDKGDLDTAQYEVERSIKINDMEVFCEGNGGLINVTKWDENNISYSIESTSGFKEEEIIEIINNIE